MKRQEKSAWVVYVLIAIAGIGFPLVALGHIEYCVMMDGQYPAEGCSKISFWDRLSVSSPNEIGDTLAGVFGSMAFLAAAIAVVLQSTELREQRKELKLSRQAQQDQVEGFEAQRFEVSFFEMISTYREIVENLRYHNGSTQTTGRDCFKFYKIDMCEKLMCVDNSSELTLQDVERLHSVFWKEARTELSHYFRFLFNFFRILDESHHAKDFHAKLLRSQISDEELTLLYYNCCSAEGRRFEEYAIKFELFDNMNKDDFAHPHHALLLDKRVFGPDKRGLIQP